MKKRLRVVSFLVLVVFLFSVVAQGPSIGFLGVDVVSAATDDSTPAESEEPSTPSSPAKSSSSTSGVKFYKYGYWGEGFKTVQTLLNNHGYNLVVDGSFGPLSLAAVKDFQSKNGLVVDGIVGPNTWAKLNEKIVVVVEEPEVVAPEETTLKLGKVDYAAHGDRSFAVAVAAVSGDTIVDAYVDEFQFQDAETAEGVPNSDGVFGDSVVEGVVLGSKRVNSEAYSAHMAEAAGATVPVADNYDAIQAYAAGMTIAELEAELTANTKESMVDVVSGVTLADTYGYLSAILEAAKEAQGSSGVEVSEETLANLELRKVDYKAHGNRSFAVAFAAVSGDTIVDAYVDEYQFQDAETAEGVPNSDGVFGDSVVEGVVLGSKRVNSEAYSAHMAEAAGATTPIASSYDAIQKFVRGMTFAELAKELRVIAPAEAADVVSGATLADTYGYLSAIYAAATSEGEVDVVSGASFVTDEDVLVESLGVDGAWIVIFTEDMTTDKELVLEGTFRNKNDVNRDIYRKLAPYTQDDNHNVLERFTLTAPKLTIKSPNARLQAGIFAGDIYVEAEGFNLKDATVEGNIYFASQEIMDSFVADENSTVTGVTGVLGQTTLKLGKVDYAAHGNRSFAVAVAAVSGDTIVDAYVDEYQFQDAETAEGVPNSDGVFGDSVVEGVVLGSKRVNSEAYSAHIAEAAGATVPVADNYDAIQAYAAGMTIAELEAELTANTKESMVDVVSGATLADTYGYLSAILEAAKEAQGNSGVEVSEETLANLELRKVDYKAHGNRSFAVAFAAVSGDTIVDAYVDEYQFQDAETAEGVPNSDGVFGDSVVEGVVLGSKRVNSEAYSAHMAEAAGATTPIASSYDAIQKFVRGMTFAELAKELRVIAPAEAADVVSGATLADTYGYLSAIYAAATSEGEVDVVSGASFVTDEDVLVESLGVDGAWIVIFTEDMTTDKELVLEGTFRNKNDVNRDIYRKLAPYTQDDNHNVLERFTLTAPKLTIKSPNARLQAGIFAGDIYVEAEGFNLKDATVKGNIYSASQELMDSFVADDNSTVTGVTEVLE